MKRNLLFLAGAVLAVLLIVVTVTTVTHYLSTSSGANNTTLACKTTGAAHTVTISQDKLSVEHTYAKACDTLTIVNADNRLRLMAFGTHEHHQPYDGVEEKTLGQGQSMTVTLNQVGTFTFHDHIEDSVVGYFTVTN